MSEQAENLQQMALFKPLPHERRPGWISQGDRVVIIEVLDEGVQLIEGNISSAADTHSGVDNIHTTVVWGDYPFNDDMEFKDDAHERNFKVKDPCLVKAEELDDLKDLERAKAWFGRTYELKCIEMIVQVIRITRLKPRDSLL